MLRIVAAAAAVALAAIPAQATTFTTAQLSNASDGLQAMRELNLIVLGNLTSGAEVEGKAYVGGTVSGNSENFGIGNSAQGFTQNTNRGVLTVGGTVSSGVTINNGSNGTSGAVSTTTTTNRIDIGGDLTGSVALNAATSSLAGSVRTGGSFNNQNYNPNSTKTATYGTTASNVQAQDAPYVTQDASLANATTGLAATLAKQTSTLRTDLTTLSDVLANQTANATLNLTDRNNIHFDYGAAASSASFVVANVNASDLFGSGGTLNLSLLGCSSGSNCKTTVINVVGAGAYTFSLNESDAMRAENPYLIWNFDNTAASNSSLSFTNGFHGSVLAPNESISNSNFIEGSVVAAMFTQGGEIHLGTYQGISSIVSNPLGSVPEPATWAMMLVGFGAVGGTMRRRPAVKPMQA